MIHLGARSIRQAGPRASAAPPAAVLTTTWLGASPHPVIEGLDPLEARSNYFIGRDPLRWRTNVPHYARVWYRGLYPGIDLVYYGSSSRGDGSSSRGIGSASSGRSGAQGLEYDLVVAPGADPNAVRLAVDGAESAVVDERGDLRLTTPAGVIVQRRPVIYQAIHGARQPVAGFYTLRQVQSVKDGPQKRYEVGITVASHDPALPLVIDPILDLSSYWGGTLDDVATGVAVDPNTGAIALAGYTDSVAVTSPLPRVNPIPGASVTGGTRYAFVTSLNPSQTAVSYSTFLGGSGITEALGIDMDGSGAVYVAGWTNAADFPICPNPNQTPSTVSCIDNAAATSNPYAFQVNYGGGSSDAFVVRINNLGDALLYATFLGGTGPDQANAIKSLNGNAYVTGTTSSTDFPTQAPWQSVYGGGASDAFMAVVNGTGNALIYSTYLGGSGEEQGLALTLETNGVSTVTGWTNSSDFPTHSIYNRPFQPVYGGGQSDAFVTRFTGDGKSLIYSTYLGGGGDDIGYAIAVASEAVFVTGSTTSTEPIDPKYHPIQATNAGGKDLFIVNLQPQGEALNFSTYLGGSEDDVAYGIASSPEGFIYITGETLSGPTDPIPFPILNPLYNSSYGGSGDAFLLRLNIDDTLDYSTYWGGEGEDVGRAVIFDIGVAYVTGTTLSTNTFQTVNPIVLTNPPYDGSKASGGIDAFLLKVDDSQTSGCDMASSGLPFDRSGRFDLGMSAAIAAAAAISLIRRLRRARRASPTGRGILPP
ncbi:MAG TPA: SBBP repeat-containing protein [Nitrospiria bacterium]|nr:SBBP repeat-containing protein [Nitrospiria bacterium]